MTVSTDVVGTCPGCGGDLECAPQLRPADYRRCVGCGLCVQPVRSPGELRGLYDEAYFDRHAGGGGYNLERRQRHHEATVRLRLLARHAPPPGRVLEIGAAGGHFLAAAGHAGYAARGVEPVPELAARARSQLGVEVEVGFLDEVELGSGSFDVACAFHVLEHLADPLAALKRLHEALREGGLVIAEVPNVESGEARRLGSAWGELQPLHHVVHFGPRALRVMLESAGFDVVRTETVPFFSYLPFDQAIHPRHLAHRLALSARGRVGLRGAHPTRHELLRAVARAH